MAKQEPDMNVWLSEAKLSENADQIGMYLFHNGVVRATPRHSVRSEAPVPDNISESASVIAVDFSYDEVGLEKAIAEARTWDGIHYVRAWLNEGRVEVGGSLMYVMVGADIRPHAISALEKLVNNIKSNLVQEREIFDE